MKWLNKKPIDDIFQSYEKIEYRIRTKLLRTVNRHSEVKLRDKKCGPVSRHTFSTGKMISLVIQSLLGFRGVIRVMLHLESCKIRNLIFLDSFSLRNLNLEEEEDKIKQCVLKLSLRTIYFNFSIKILKSISLLSKECTHTNPACLNLVCFF